MAQQSPQPAASRSELSWTTGAVSNAPPAEMLQQRRHSLVHRDATIAATEHITQHAQLKIVRVSGSNKIRKQHVIGCEYMHTMVTGQ